MKMSYWVISLVPVHVDDHPIERANTRHGSTIVRRPGWRWPTQTDHGATAEVRQAPLPPAVSGGHQEMAGLGSKPEARPFWCQAEAGGCCSQCADVVELLSSCDTRCAD